MPEVSEVNRKHFDAHASAYDASPWVQKLAEQLTDELHARLGWIGVDWVDEDLNDGKEKMDALGTKREIKMLDYACGPGMMSRALAPYTTRIIGIDVSQGMVDVYNKGAHNQGLTIDEMHAVRGNLLSTPPSPDLIEPYEGFDLACVGMGFHHFEDTDLAAKRLVQRLKRGTGRLLILDFLPHEPVDMSDLPASQDVKSTVIHMGFAEGAMRKLFSNAGCVDIKFEVLGTGLTHGMQGEKMSRSIFICVGTRA